MSRHRLVLASASPRRRELLGAVGIACTVRPVDADETRHADEPAPEYVRRLARLKAEAAAVRPGETLVLGADTVVVVDGDVLGKPTDPAHARTMLARLSGRSHQVMTAICVVRHPEGRAAVRLGVTEVEFEPFPETWIDAYVASGEPMDKAGAYAIQQRAGLYARAIHGSHANVVGLPLELLPELLREVGVDVLDLVDGGDGEVAP